MKSLSFFSFFFFFFVVQARIVASATATKKPPSCFNDVKSSAVISNKAHPIYAGGSLLDFCQKQLPEGKKLADVLPIPGQMVAPNIWESSIRIFLDSNRPTGEKKCESIYPKLTEHLKKLDACSGFLSLVVPNKLKTMVALRQEAKSADGKFQCHRLGHETQDFDHCNSAIEAHAILIPLEQAATLVNQVVDQSVAGTETLQLSQAENKQKKALEMQGTAIERKIAQLSSVSAVQISALGTFSHLLKTWPTIENIKSECLRKEGAQPLSALNVAKKVIGDSNPAFNFKPLGFCRSAIDSSFFALSLNGQGRSIMIQYIVELTGKIIANGVAIGLSADQRNKVNELISSLDSLQKKQGEVANMVQAAAENPCLLNPALPECVGKTYQGYNTAPHQYGSSDLGTSQGNSVEEKKAAAATQISQIGRKDSQIHGEVGTGVGTINPSTAGQGEHLIGGKASAAQVKSSPAEFGGGGGGGAPSASGGGGGGGSAGGGAAPKGGQVQAPPPPDKSVLQSSLSYSGGSGLGGGAAGGLGSGESSSGGGENPFGDLFKKEEKGAGDKKDVLNFGRDLAAEDSIQKGSQLSILDLIKKRYDKLKEEKRFLEQQEGN